MIGPWKLTVTAAIVFAIMASPSFNIMAKGPDMLIDDFSNEDFVSALGTRWRSVSDQVMGGISEASVIHDVIGDRTCLRLRGDVRLENDGGFIQASLDLDPEGRTFDASRHKGIRLFVRGNGEQYSLHLRTKDSIRPWQSYRAHFTADREWEIVEIPFSKFAPHRLEASLDPTALRRIGLVAIGRAFRADLAVARIEFYSPTE